MKDKLLMIQQDLKAPKGQTNKFGGYRYRSCEDIFEAVKPLLKKHELVLTTTDELVYIGERYYVKATAILTDGENTITNTAYAREEETKKGMDSSQITGASSSYARKYALNGLFLIDDVRDSDATNDAEQQKYLDQLVQIKKLMTKKKIAPNEIYDAFGKKSDEMTSAELDEVIEWLGEK